MKRETIAIHGGYQVEPTTKAVAVPIYQTVAYAFDSADHGAALFNLEVEGHRYSRISNPTTALLDERVAALEGGVAAPALFNLEVEGHRYSRISNPSTAVLEERVAARQGGREALATSTGQAALYY